MRWRDRHDGPGGILVSTNAAARLKPPSASARARASRTPRAAATRPRLAGKRRSRTVRAAMAPAADPRSRAARLARACFVFNGFILANIVLGALVRAHGA